jgi:hypothetical protein
VPPEKTVYATQAIACAPREAGYVLGGILDGRDRTRPSHRGRRWASDDDADVAEKERRRLSVPTWG